MHVRVLAGQTDAACRCGQLDRNGVAHAVETVLSAPLPLDSHQRVKALLGGHLVVAAAVGGVLESAVRLPELHQRVQHRDSVLYKARIVLRDAKLGQRDNHLHDALRIGDAAIGKAAIVGLLLAHAVQRLLRRLRHGGLVLILRQRLQRHAGNVCGCALALVRGGGPAG